MVNFKGANEQKLYSVMAELQEKVPTGSVMTAKKHDKLSFKVFKPTHMAPQGYKNMANADKMKAALLKFAESETVTKEVGDVAAFKEWLHVLELSSIP